MSLHRPDVITQKRPDGRWLARCLSCMESSPASFHRPIAEDWRKTHIREAVPPNKETRA